MHNNDWYKKGELPPVGSVVEFKRFPEQKDSRWDKCEVLGYAKNYAWLLYDGIPNSWNVSTLDLRPIPTERDRLVERAMAVFKENHPNLGDTMQKTYAEDLIDAGWRPVKQQSEDEFIKDATIKGFLDYGQLYRAGCRFLDMGDE